MQAAAQAASWKMVFFHDEDETELKVADAAFGSAARGIVVGTLDWTKRERSRPVALLTSDGGTTWEQTPLRERPVSVFLLNDSLGWLVTDKGLWQTEESGRSWRKLKAPGKDLLRVHFLTPERGWAVGARKQVYATDDGGENWTEVVEAKKPDAKDEHSWYGGITFANDRTGLISGWSRPPRRDEGRLPDWVEPERNRRRRQWPTMTMLLETRDGGQTWSSSVSSLFGRVSRITLSPQGWGLSLLLFEDQFQYPSEVVRLDWTTGKSASTFREKDRRITDVWIDGGRAFLGGTEHVGPLARSPIPRKVSVYESENGSPWRAMDVDYRAVARAVRLAGSGGRYWLVTDTGMILRLEP